MLKLLLDDGGHDWQIRLRDCHEWNETLAIARAWSFGFEDDTENVIVRKTIFLAIGHSLPLFNNFPLIVLGYGVV
jgi:hypothetical protein